MKNKPKPPFTWIEHYKYTWTATNYDGPNTVKTMTWDYYETWFKDYSEVPNWEELVASGKQATGYFRRWNTADHKDYLSGFWYVSWPPILGPGDGYFAVSGPFWAVPAPIPYSAGPVLEALAKAKASFVQKLRSERTKVQGGVVAVEIAEVFKMIRDRSIRLRQSAENFVGFCRSLKSAAHHKIHRGRPREGVLEDLMKDLADGWLETAFGWKPLISDVKSGSEALAEIVMNDRKDFVLIRAKSDVREAIPSQTMQGYGRLHVRCEHLLTRTDTVKYLGGVDATVASPLVMQAGILGFRPEEFLPTVWEVIPYSFLVDYFVNVNEVIDSWSYRNVGLKWLQQTWHMESASKTSVFNDTPRYCALNGFSLNSSGGSGGAPTQVSKQVLRSIVSPNVLVADLRLKLPGIGQTINIAALLASHRKLVPLM